MGFAQAVMFYSRSFQSWLAGPGEGSDSAHSQSPDWPRGKQGPAKRETLPLGHLNWEMGRESGRGQALKQERYHDLALGQEWPEEAEMMRKKNLQPRKDTQRWRSQGSYKEPVSVEGNRREGERDQGQCRGREEKSRATLRRESGHAASSTEVLKDSSYKVWSRQDSLTVSSTLN